MIELSVIRDLVAIFGVIAGFSYYVLTVRNAQRTRDLTLKAQEQAVETRQLQLFMQLYEKTLAKENWTAHLEILNEWSWKDFNDFWNKYGEDNNLEAWRKLTTTCAPFEHIGLLVRDGMIEPKRVWDFYGFFLTNLWEKILPVVDGYREKIGDERFLEWFEDLYYDMIDLREKESMLFKERVSRRKKHRAELNI